MKACDYEHIIEDGDNDDKMIVDEGSIGDRSTNDADSDWAKTPRSEEVVPSTHQTVFQYCTYA